MYTEKRLDKWWKVGINSVIEWTEDEIRCIFDDNLGIILLISS